MLSRVGLSPRHGESFPHELSGGQLQRAAIARALVAEPDLVVCDEAVSALDKSVQAQVLNLMASLQEELGVSYLFISHDLSVVEHISDRVLVMYLGRVVEEGPAGELYDRPAHQVAPVLGPPVQRGAGDAAGRAAEPRRSAFWLRLPHPVPLGDGALRGRAALTHRESARPTGRLPPQ
jgi:ABC-type glutathione transport system ATPase component